MSILDEDFPGVIFLSEAASKFCIVPFEIDACIFLSIPIDCYGVVLTEHRI